MRSQYALTPFHRVFRDFDAASAPRSRSTFRPHIDFVETADAYELTLDVPGIGEGGFDIRFDEGVLEIAGERPVPEAAEEDRVIRRERPHGRFVRRVAFRDDIAVDAIAATVRDGVLTVTVPKSERAKPRQIPVTVH